MSKLSEESPPNEASELDICGRPPYEEFDQFQDLPFIPDLDNFHIERPASLP
jgi:hypothetical protein